MEKGGKRKNFREPEKSKLQIIGKEIEKKNGKGKKLEAVAMGVESLSSTVSGSDAPNMNTSVTKDEYAGYIFLCSRITKPECFIYRVFGLPSFRIDVVAKIKRNTKLFLFDFDVKLLYGVYAASSTGAMSLEPDAFGGKFPAQVRFEIFKECMPIPESDFKHVLNYQGWSKFKQDLSANQVDELISLFRPLSSTLPAPHQASESQYIGSSVLSNEIQSRRILHQEIEKQIQFHGISSPVVHQASESHSSYRAPQIPLPCYDPERPLTSVHRVYELPSVPYQHLPVSRLLPQTSSYFPEHPQQSYIPEYLASTPQRLSGGPLTSAQWVHEQPNLLYQHLPASRLLPQNSTYFLEHPQQSYIPEYLASTPQRLSSRETNGPFHSGIDSNLPMGPSNDYYLNQNPDFAQKHGQAQIETHISAPPQGSDRTPSSVLAAAYWAAVASEIPQPGGPQNSDSVHNMTGQISSTSLQYKPPNCTSASILEAYWEAKALEDSCQTQPSHPPMLGSNSQITAESGQGPSQNISAPCWVAPGY